MKTEAEIRKVIKECKDAGIPGKMLASRDKCPFEDSCCPECSRIQALEWVLSEFKTPREYVDDYYKNF